MPSPARGFQSQYATAEPTILASLKTRGNLLHWESHARILKIGMSGELPPIPVSRLVHEGSQGPVQRAGFYEWLG